MAALGAFSSGLSATTCSTVAAHYLAVVKSDDTSLLHRVFMAVLCSREHSATILSYNGVHDDIHTRLDAISLYTLQSRVLLLELRTFT
jgi:hypothetical protein